MTGGDFFRWSEELRDVEEMLEDPGLRSETARIRDRARGIRNDFRRNRPFKGPNWEEVRISVLNPLNALRDRIKEALLRRNAKGTQVPLDRDPVPSQYEEQVRRYYEKLGSGR